MNPVAKKADANYLPTPIATYKVRFGKRNGAGTGNGKTVSSGRIPRVTRLLALAHRIEGMVRAGQLKDWAEASRVIGVTRARVTQIGNLLLLTPEIQKIILFLPPILKGQDVITERNLRPIVIHPEWNQQNCTLEKISTFHSQNLRFQSFKGEFRILGLPSGET